jgi:putative transposase
MARPLRMDIEGGWYHVTSRGIERRAIFRNDRDREHFLELLEAMVGRFGVVLHAYVLMDNHYHLIVECPEANLSRAIQWLNVSYVAWFNRRHDRVGPLMQGRFKSILVENSAWAYDLSVYVHLNNVMRKDRALGKRAKKAESEGLSVPTPEEVRERLRELHAFRWSSLPAYLGAVPVPEWLTIAAILRRAHRDAERRIAQYRADMEGRLTKGVEPAAGNSTAAFAIGTSGFVEHVRKQARIGREVAEPKGLRRAVPWADLLRLAQRVTGESLETVLTRRGSVGRPLLLWAARRYGRMTLREAGDALGGRDYTAVAMAIRRFETDARTDPGLQEVIEKVRRHCEE